MAKEETKKEEKTWTTSLAIVSEEKPPVKVIYNNQTGVSLTLEDAIADIKNDLEELKQLLD